MAPRFPKYVKVYRDRHGKMRYYFAPKGAKQVPLPGFPFTTEFMDAYAAAKEVWENSRKGSTTQIGLDRIRVGSIDALVHAYYRSAQFQNLKPITQKTYRGILEAMRTSFGSFSVSTLKRRNIEAIMAKKADKPEAANGILKMFRILMPLAMRLEMRDDDPTKGIKKLKSQGSGYVSWEEDDVAAFYAHYPARSKPRLAFDLMIYTGLRRSDIVRLGWQHLNDGVLSIRQSKTGREVDIPVHPYLAEVFRSLKRDDLTFLRTEYGKPFTPAGFGNWFRNRVREVGLRDELGAGEMGLSAHGLRKAILRRLAEAGCSAHQIIAISGHQNISEVMRYTEAADRKQLGMAAISAISGHVPKTETGTK